MGTEGGSSDADAEGPALKNHRLPDFQPETETQKPVKPKSQALKAES